MLVCGYIHINLAVYGSKIIVLLWEIIHLVHGFLVLHVFVAVIQASQAIFVFMKAKPSVFWLLNGVRNNLFSEDIVVIVRRNTVWY